MSSSTKEVPGPPPLNDKAQVTQAYEVPFHRIPERDRGPSHLARPPRPLGNPLYSVVNFLMVGDPDFDYNDLWELTDQGYRYYDKAWESTRELWVKRLKHINLVAGLFLAAVLAFSTTEPPENGSLLPYTTRGPYFLILWAAGSTFASVSSGLCLVFVLQGAEVQWFHETMASSRSRIWATVIILLFPPCSLILAANALAAGLFIAASHSEIPIVKYCFWMPLVPPWLCVFVFCFLYGIRKQALGVAMLGSR